VALAAKKPVVLVVTGSSVDLSMPKANPKVGAIVWIGYAGQAGGAGVADVIFGKHNPDGRLTSTMYPRWVELSLFEMSCTRWVELSLFEISCTSSISPPYSSLLSLYSHSLYHVS
jgi:hypothetical protein